MLSCTSFISRGDPKRITSRSVLRLTDGSGRVVGGKDAKKDQLTEEERAIQDLLHKQLDTTKESITR